MCGPVSVAGLVAELAGGGLAGGGLAGVGLVEAAGQELVALRGMMDALEGVWLGRMADFDRAGAAAAAGAVSTAAWLRARCRLSPGTARDQVLLARRLAEALPVTAAALRAGEISARPARVNPPG